MEIGVPMKKLALAKTMLLVAVPAIVALGGRPLVRSAVIVESADAATASKLGDLSSFRAIVLDTATWSTRVTLPRRRRGSRISKRRGMRPRPV
jgi:hypothetical protein